MKKGSLVFDSGFVERDIKETDAHVLLFVSMV